MVAPDPHWQSDDGRIELSEDYCRQAVTRLTVGDKGLRVLAAAENAGSEQLTLNL